MIYFWQREPELSEKGLWKGGKGVGQEGWGKGVGQGGWGKGGQGGWILYYNEVFNKTGIISSD